MKDKLGIIIAIVVVAGFGIFLFTRDDTGNTSGETDQYAQNPTGSVTITPVPTATTMQQYDEAPASILEEGIDYIAVLKTNKGEITIDLHEDATPVTVNNFVFLAQDGYYTNVPFHRIISGFMLQTGDPTGTGRGNPGYQFEDEEFEGEYTRGTVAMANAGPDTNGSQFFIMHQNYPLPANYVIFGTVTEGLDVVDVIAETPVEANAMGELSVPTENIYIESVEIVTK